MPKACFKKNRIQGLVTVVPRETKSIDDEVHLYGGQREQIERIKKTIGLHERHVVAEGVTAGDLCEAAARRLLERCSVDAGEVDGIIMVTQTPDYFQPATACVLHGRLGLKEDCAAFDVNLGCSGYVYALWLAGMMVETGACRKVLVLAGDTISRCVNPRDRALAPLFGDAGSATLVVEAEEETESWFSLKSDGKGFEHLIVPAGAFRHPSTEETRREETDAEGNVRSLEQLRMNGAEVFNFSIKVEPVAIREILEFAGKTVEEVDYLVFHQANRYIISNIARRLKIPLDKVPCSTVERYGNQSCASIPGTICDCLAREVSERRVRLVLSGFGVGLSWASCLLDLDHLDCCEVVEV
ncbi:MAG: ketoacyl-ACP synthase III [Opitutales bacterium]